MKQIILSTEAKTGVMKLVNRPGSKAIIHGSMTQFGILSYYYKSVSFVMQQCDTYGNTTAIYNVEV